MRKQAPVSSNSSGWREAASWHCLGYFQTAQAKLIDRQRALLFTVRTRC
jgi:hypothetical protein